MERAQNAIMLYLDNKVPHEVAKDDTTTKLWLKLESLYMMKSLTSHLYFEKVVAHFIDGRRYIH